MKSLETTLRWANLALTLTLLCACYDTPTPIIGPVAATEDLSLEYKSIALGGDTAVSLQRAAEMSQRSREKHGVSFETRALAGTGEAAMLLQTLEDAGFSTRSGNAYAYVSGWMKYFGTNGRVHVSAVLQYNGQSLSMLPATAEKSNLEPSVQDLGVSSTAYIAPNCGHRVFGTANYRAWGSSNLPSAPTSAFMPVEDTKSSRLAQQADCPPNKKDEDVVSQGGSGGEDTRLQDDGWYMCRYEVWYDGAGNELSRRLLGCWPL